MMSDIDRNNMNAKKLVTNMRQRQEEGEKERQRETKKMRSIDRMTELKLTGLRLKFLCNLKRFTEKKILLSF